MEIDLQHILRRESEQVEWKECLADEDDGVKTLTAFANDYQNLGGGYLIVGATEGQDENGFAVVSLTGLSAVQAKKLEGKVMALCRECVTPPILPQVELLPGPASDKKVLVFIQPRTPHVHEFRSRKGPQRYWVRANNTTVEARNGVLRELLTKKGSAPPFDQQPCSQSTKEDLDVTKIASFLQRTGRPAEGAVDFIDPDRKLHATVQPLVCRSSLGSEVRPRNFSILLFGRDVSKFFPNAHVVCSSYPGFDRSESVAEKVEIWGDLPQQIEDTLRFIRIHNRQLMDKTDLIRPNTYKYPPNAVQEALVNSLVHRDYQSPHPVRVTVFLDRIEIYSPGALAREVSLASLRQGRTDPVWRNQSLAWFLDALQYSQAQGQGIGTILRSLKALGSPPASFESEGESFRCVLPANPLHVSKTVLDLVKEFFHSWDLTSLIHTLEQAQQFQVNLSQVWEWLAVAALTGSRAPEVLLNQLGRLGFDLRMGALRVARRSLEAILGIQVTDDEFWERRDLLFDRAWNLLQQTKGGEQLDKLEIAEGLVSSIILYWDSQNPPRL